MTSTVGGRRASTPAARRDRALTAALVALIAWGVLAFGAVYPWAYWPLIGGSAVLGLLAFSAGSPAPALPAALRPIVAALAAIATVALLQTVPLPPRVCTAISPATESSSAARTCPTPLPPH